MQPLHMREHQSVRRAVVVNYIDWRAHVVMLLRQQLETMTAPVIHALLAEIAAYPAPAGGVVPAISDGPHRYATPLRIETRLGTVSFLNTNTIFGTPTDVTLSELALEMLFPADEQTVAIVKAMVEEEATQRGLQQQEAG